MNNQADSISSVLTENRSFAPWPAFAANSSMTADILHELYDRAETYPEQFWADQASTLRWEKPWSTVMTWDHPHVTWFDGGELNAAVNCVDRHIAEGHGTKRAILWEGEPGDRREWTYDDLHVHICKAANMLQAHGVKAGDVVAIYMGMVPEAVAAMLACARIGAVHNVVFGGFSSEALRDRIVDSQAVAVITQDAAYRRGDVAPLLPAVRAAVSECPTIENVFIVQRMEGRIDVLQNEHLWHEELQQASAEHDAQAFPSEHPLFILYTSGSTGKPKGILHTTGGYLTQTSYSSRLVFDLKPDDVYFCTADIGWITGHSYVVYGMLSNAATIVMYEGAPNYPRADRFWEIIDRYHVTIFYTAPTAIRAFMKWGDEWPARHSLSSLRLLGTVGEPINPEAWMWFHTTIGKGQCPIVDTWWQTETGSIMIAPVPSVTTTKPGTATKPLPGVSVDVVRKDGTSCEAGEGGLLVVKRPWPSMLRTVFGNHERYVQAYWSEFPPSATCPGWYFTGDGARRDDDGNIWIIGRVDDVVNVSGHRLGTAEIESALVSHPSVAEAAVVARPDDLKGNALVAFVSLTAAADRSHLQELREELRAHVSKEIGAIAKPDDVRFTDSLPKTRSGKIMRRLLREVVTGGQVSGDTTTLEDFGVLEALRSNNEE